MTPRIGDGGSVILRGDARHLPLTDSSVDLVVTSPPYFSLRSYTDGGEHYAGQVGAEATPAEFVDALLEVTAECVRVLKPSGSIWVNLGDKYAGVGGSNGFDWCIDSEPTQERRRKTETPLHRGRNAGGVRSKSLFGIPWRYALRCIDDLGLILRAEVIWSKPNGLPESVTDRVRRSHEQWFHMVKEPRYFSAVDEVREAYNPTSVQHAEKYGKLYATEYGAGNHGVGNSTLRQSDLNPLGKLPGSVWTVPTSPLTVPDHLGVDHFAAFPPEFPKRIILGWSPAGVCVECGEGRRPVAVTDLGIKERQTPRYSTNGDTNHGGMSSSLGSRGASAVITGYACDCPAPDAPTRPAVVLDPFSGTGTTAMVARALGRIGIGIDLSADYCRLGQWRTNDAAQHAKVRGENFRKPEPQIPGQSDLFGGAA